MADASVQPPHEVPPVLPGFEHVNRYWDRTHGTYAAKILPGEYYVTNAEEAVVTTLGSCIAVCVRDPVAGVGGMNHFMLPRRGEEGVSTDPIDLSAATRYGNYAMEHLINDIIKRGGRRDRFEVKVFGGGRILSSMTDIGLKNIAFAHEYLRMEGLAIVSEDVGDIHPRKVIYFPLTGRARVKRLRSLHNDTVAEREIRYMQDLRTESVEGEVELF